MISSFVTKAKFVFLKIPKVKTENVRVWHRKSLLMEKAPTEKIEALVVPQIYLALWASPRVFMALGELIYRSAGGGLAICGKRASTPDFPGQWNLGKHSSVQVLVLPWSFGSVCVGGSG